MSAAYDFAADQVRRIYDRRIHAPAVLDQATHFPAAPAFVARWRDLRDEAYAVGAHLHGVPRFHELMRAQSDISSNDGRDWRMFVVKAYGVPIRANLAVCPVLASLLADTPAVLSACLSFIGPRKHIPRHRGPFRGILRFHLGLSVPLAADARPGVVLAIDDVPYRVGDGETLLWDDTYPHELWNRTDQVRIALLLDVRRSGMPLDMRLLSRLVTGFVAWRVRLRHIGDN